MWVHTDDCCVRGERQEDLDDIRNSFKNRCGMKRVNRGRFSKLGATHSGELLSLRSTVEVCVCLRRAATMAGEALGVRQLKGLLRRAHCGVGDLQEPEKAGGVARPMYAAAPAGGHCCSKTSAVPCG